VNKRQKKKALRKAAEGRPLTEREKREVVKMLRKIEYLVYYFTEGMCNFLNWLDRAIESLPPKRKELIEKRIQETGGFIDKVNGVMDKYVGQP